MFNCVGTDRCVLEIKRSKFISISRVISGREDVKAFVAELRGEFPDATHICYGYIGRNGDDFGYSDDGEPSGTAGRPIYQALCSAEVVRSCIAVVRYFGGIKLGAGGLTRAYRDAACGLIEKAGISRAEPCTVYTACCTPDAFKRVSAAVRGTQMNIDGIVYSALVEFSLSAPTECDISGISALCSEFSKAGENIVLTKL